MAQVTVQTPDRVQVKVSANTVQSAFTVGDPALRTIAPSGSETIVNLEGNTNVAVAGSLASVINYFSALDVDFGVAGTGANNDVVFGTASVRINGRRAPNYVHVTDTNGYIKIGDATLTQTGGKFSLGGDTLINLSNLEDVPSISSGDAGKVLTVNSTEDGYEYSTVSGGGGGGGATTYTALTDTPGSLGTAGQVVSVNSTGTALEFSTINIPTVDKATIDALLINAATLDGKDSTDLQNYNNLSNAPTIPSTTGELTNDSGFITISDVPTSLSELTNDTNFANVSYVDSQVSDLVNSAPETMNTLQELSNALQNNPQTVQTILDQLGTKANTAMLADIATNPTYYNLTNRPVISTVGLTGEWEDILFKPELYTQLEVAEKIANTVTQSYVNALSINAATVDNRDATNFFERNNPQFPSLIGDFSNVDANTNLADGMVLMYHSANDTFVMGNALGTATIGQLFNVDVGVDNITSPGYFIKSTGNEGSAEWAADLLEFADLSNTPTTISGYGITDAFDGEFSSLTNTPTTMLGYGITDAFDGAYSSLVGEPTKLSEFQYDIHPSVNLSIANTVTFDFIQSLNANVAFLNGQNGDHYLDYTNFTNKPLGLSEFNYDIHPTVNLSIANTVTSAFVSSLNANSAIANNALNLGGQNASYYLNWENFTNKPTAVSDFTNDLNFATQTYVNDQMSGSINASYLGTQLPSYYLDYDNFINTPSIPAAGNIDIGDLKDVSNTAPSTGQVLKWDGNQWGPGADIVGSGGGGGGGGSGNADTLDGFDGSYYLDWTNVYGKPTALSDFTNDLDLSSFANTVHYANTAYVNNTILDIVTKSYVDTLNLEYTALANTPTLLSQFTNDPVFANTDYVNTTIESIVTKSYVESFNVNSAFLDGETKSYYLDYQNFTNTPTIPTNLSELANDVNFVDTTYVTSVIEPKANTTMLSDYALTSYVDTKVANVVDSAPETLDTLKELSDALGADENFSTTMTTQLGLKANTAMLSNVATTGDYTDLSNLPDLDNLSSIPTALSQLANDTNFIDQTFVESKLDIKANTAMLADVATSGSYTDLINIPSLAGNISDLTDDVGIVTRSNISDYGIGTLENVANGANSTSTSNGMVLLFIANNSLETGGLWTPSTIGQISQGVFQSFTGTQLLGLISTVGTPVPDFDADKLDSQQGSYYLDYQNFTSTPTNLDQFNNDQEKLTDHDGNYIVSENAGVDTIVTEASGPGFVTLTNTVTTIGSTVNKTYIDLLQSNAGTLNFTQKTLTEAGDTIVTEIAEPILTENSGAKESSYFLDYTNLQNTPNTISGVANVALTGNIHSLNDVSDVLPTDGQILKWSSSNSSWYAADDGGGSGGGGGGGSFSGFANTLIIGTPTTDYGGSLLQDGATVVMKANSTVADGFDILNETILNIRNNTYVRHAQFTMSVTGEASGHSGHNHSPLTVNFTDTGDYTLASPTHEWTFQTSSGDQTSGETNPSFTWNEANGGEFQISHKVYSNDVEYPGSAGSFSIHTANVVVTTPLPVPSFVADVTTFDLDGGGTQVTFTNNSQSANRFLFDFGDGTTWPTGGQPDDPTGSGAGNAAWLETSAPVSHTYTGTVDQRFTVKLYAWHTSHDSYTPHSSHVINQTRTNYLSGYVAATPSFTFTTLTGNNQAPEDQPDGSNIEGHKVTLTNTTSGVGNFGQQFTWKFDDDATNASWIQAPGGSTGESLTIDSQSGSPGDYNVDVVRYFRRQNTSVHAAIVYKVKLQVVTGHSNSPFETAETEVEVYKDPRANFSFGMKNNPTGHGSYSATSVGFLFTGYDGLDYNIVTFNDDSENVNAWQWDFNNAGSIDQSTQGPHDYQYTTSGQKSVKLIATGTTSESATDDTETKSAAITINPAPNAPGGMSGSLSITNGTTGTSPKIATGATDNSGGSIPAAGQSAKRIVSSGDVVSSTSDWFRAWPGNTDTTGSVMSIINGSIDSTITLAVSGNAQTSGTLEITQESDANSLDASSFPNNFFKILKAKVKKASNSVGYNTFALRHTDALGTSNVSESGWMQDDFNDTPVINSAWTVTQVTPGTLRYVSGIPYYNSGAQVRISQMTIEKICGQMYRDTSSFVTVQNATGSSMSGSVTFNYADTLGQDIPNANSLSAQNISPMSININGSGEGLGTIKASCVNINGSSAEVINSQQIKYWFTSISFDETNLPSSHSAGATLKRVELGLSGATPSFTPANFSSTSPWNSQTSTITGTDEAVTLPNGVNHNTTDYSGFLPVGPNYSSGRSGIQYVTFAFNKQATWQFTLTISGTVSSAHAAMPGTILDDACSDKNGWCDMSVGYDGFGIPGAGSSSPSPNGVNGCGDNDTTGPVPLNTAMTNKEIHCFLISNSSGSGNQGSCMLLRFGLSSGQSITSIKVDTRSYA